VSTPRARKKAPDEAAPPPLEATVETLAEAPLPADLTTVHVEPVFADRVSPAPPERPFPSAHRAIFFDVENTSRAAHIARVIEQAATMEEAAKILGIDPATLYRKRKRMGE